MNRKRRPLLAGALAAPAACLMTKELSPDQKWDLTTDVLIVG